MLYMIMKKDNNVSGFFRYGKPRQRLAPCISRINHMIEPAYVTEYPTGRVVATNPAYLTC